LEPVTFAAQAEPPSVYADRGFGTRIGDDALDKHKVADAVIPAGPSLARRADAELATPLPFRNGLEGRISQLKRKGLARTRLRSLAGAQTWVGSVALAHNLQRIALLT
jgi:hypothetical protein